MGINFSRLLTLKYGNSVSNYLGMKYSVISVGRVMTCVLGMIVRRERGDQKVRQDAVLPCDSAARCRGAADRGRVPRRGGLPVFPVAEALQGERL